jgi:carbonic anhydrase/acetyltransferase-like protein (isoleucine patch superfamily)
VRASLLPFAGRQPRIAADAFVAPNATLIGDVTIEDGASVWFGAVLRADVGSIVVGEGSCVQDNAVVHCAAGLPTTIGRSVTIGHGALLEGCVVGNGAVISMGAIVLQRAYVGERALVAAGAVVREGQEIPPAVVAAGVPAVVKKDLEGPAQEWVAAAAEYYRRLRERYLDDTVTTGEGA